MVKIGVHAELGVNQENFSPVQFCQYSTTPRQNGFLLVAMPPFLVCFTAAVTVPGSSPGRAKSGRKRSALWNFSLSARPCGFLPSVAPLCPPPQILPPCDSERYCRSRSQEASNLLNYSLFPPISYLSLFLSDFATSEGLELLRQHELAAAVNVVHHLLLQLGHLLAQHVGCGRQL